MEIVGNGIVCKTARVTSTTRWKNWFGNVEVPLDAHLSLSEEDEISALVSRAAADGGRVRAHGAGHSNTPIVSGGGTLLDLRPTAGLRGIDRRANTATFGAGTTVAEVGALLWDAGLSPLNQGDINSQYLAGAVSTATHGTGVELGSFSGAVQSLRLVDGSGRVREISQDTLELLRAARTSVGALGIITEITLAVAPAFNLALRFEHVSWAEALDRWDHEVRSHRHFTLYWSPDGTNSWIPGGSSEPSGPGLAVMKFMDHRPADDESTGNKAAGTFVAPAWQVWPDDYLPDYHEFEYMIPLAAGREAVERIRELILRDHPDQILPIEIRFCGADDAMLSPLAGRETCVVSVAGVMGSDNSRFFADCDRILAEYGGRPHWGKAHLLDADRLRAVYPEFGDFLRIRADLDPAGVFDTDASRIAFGS